MQQTRKLTRAERRRIDRENEKKYATGPGKDKPYFIEVKSQDWPPVETNEGEGRFKVFVNEHFLVQLFNEDNDIVRMTVNRLKVKKSGHWEDGITWDELMQIKRTIGYGSSFGVEAYPEDLQVINVANMRHIFLLPEAPSWAWRN